MLSLSECCGRTEQSELMLSLMSNKKLSKVCKLHKLCRSSGWLLVKRYSTNAKVLSAIFRFLRTNKNFHTNNTAYLKMYILVK